MGPKNHYVDEEEELLLNDPEYIDILSQAFEEEDNCEELYSNDDEDILSKFGY